MWQLADLHRINRNILVRTAFSFASLCCMFRTCSRQREPLCTVGGAKYIKDWTVTLQIEGSSVSFYLVSDREVTECSSDTSFLFTFQWLWPDIHIHNILCVTAPVDFINRQINMEGNLTNVTLSCELLVQGSLQVTPRYLCGIQNTHQTHRHTSSTVCDRGS